jgi:cell division protein DivIC
MALVGHYKYAIVIIAGIILVGFVDENSFMHRVQLEMQISDLRQQIDKYNTQNEDDMRKLKELNHDPGAYQKIARERYFMQTDDEEISKKLTKKEVFDELMKQKEVRSFVEAMGLELT